jgi:AcrR family transcriptional regulator
VQRPGPQPRITADDIVEAAIAVGIGRFTITDIARHLGIAAPVLYRWVADREEVLDLVADHVIAQVQPPPAPSDGDWRPWLADYAVALRAGVEHSPGAAARTLTRYQVSPAAVRLHAALIDAFDAGGMDRTRAPATAELVHSALLGWIAREQAHKAPRKDGRRIADEIRAARAAAGVPTSPGQQRGRATADERYARLVDVLIAGIDATT